MPQPNDYETESQTTAATIQARIDALESSSLLRDSEESIIKATPSTFEKLIGWTTVASAAVLWVGVVIYLGYWLAK